MRIIRELRTAWHYEGLPGAWHLLKVHVIWTAYLTWKEWKTGEPQV